MFSIGNRDTKLTVSSWNGKVTVHLRKFFKSKFNKTKLYPSKQGIALTLAEWEDLKALTKQVDEVVLGTEALLQSEVDEEQQARPKYERQMAINEDTELQIVGEIIKLNKGKVTCAEQSQVDNRKQLLRSKDISEQKEQNQRQKLLRPEDFNENANFAFEFVKGKVACAEQSQTDNRKQLLRSKDIGEQKLLRPEDFNENANFAFEYV